ncbi:MAG TPA: DEAD/DEAH box helicase family protein [Terrimicrobiaceae bacterium]
MPVTPQDVAAVKSVSLPAVRNVYQRVGPLLIEQVAMPATDTTCIASVLDTSRGTVSRLSAKFGPVGDTLLINRRGREDLFGRTSYIIDDSNFTVEDSRLVMSRAATWVEHPRMLRGSSEYIRQAVRQSWTSGVVFNVEQRDENGNLSRPGMRPPQLGALHAVAAHWSVSSKPGLAVMPTGTGKTETMLACLIMKRPERLLVLVPSDALRSQTLGKFCSLGKLRELGVVPQEILNPVVGRLKGSLTEEEHLHVLEKCNVVVSTVASLNSMPVRLRAGFRDLFDLVYFDEAHHVPSNSWDRLFDTFQKQPVLQFTATPFREDGRRMPGKIIYNFPLRMAQSQGYFRKIKFCEVFEPDDQESDLAIAEAAVQALRSDMATGRDHILLARTDTKDKAEALFQLYRGRCGDLNPIVIYSGIPRYREKMKAIVEKKHRIIVCVDMFGEGFDLPNLKVAALHSPHKSLAVTLQFCGRFTRDAKDIGDATLVANIADPSVSDAIEDLYAEDSDWNELIPELSYRAIESQVNFSDFLDRMDRSEKGDDELFDLNVLKPKTSTVIFKANGFSPRRFRQGIKKVVDVERTWISRDKDLLVFITRSRVPIEWASIKETSNEIWDLYVLAFDGDSGLLFINSSQKSSLHHDLARAVGGKDVKLLEGERMFRAFSGINRLIFHNAGLYRRGAKLRFRMYTGLDIGEAISPTAQVGSSKSNLFGVGYDNGQRVSVGASHKGRVWSMSSSSIPDWRQWCTYIARRIQDESIPTNDFLRHTLIPSEIDALPQKEFFAAVLPAECYAAEAQDFRLFSDGKEVNFHDFAILSHDRISDTEVLVYVGIADKQSATFQLRWGPQKGDFDVTQSLGNRLEIRKGTEGVTLAEFFRENPPALFATEGSEVRGASLFEARNELPFTYSLSDICAGPWDGINIRQESKWRNGQRRNDSVQAAWMQYLLGKSNSFVFDDDGTGEVADIVEISECDGVIHFHLYHCKFSGGKEPGQRVKDCYEVCGQAVRSVRWTINPARLLEHLQKRERPDSLGGRMTRFERGTLRELSSLRKRARKLRKRFSISIVQPGISKNQLPAEIAAILGAADSFVTEFTGARLGVIGGV